MGRGPETQVAGASHDDATARTWPRGLAMVALGWVWLLALPGCEAVTSKGQAEKEFRRALVVELCAPGAYYLECWWSSAALCHEEMAVMVANSVPSNMERVQPNEALRQRIFERLFFLHTVILSTMTSPEFDREGCMDETRWKHVPPGKEGTMARIREKREKMNRTPDAPSAPVTPATTAPAPEPSPGTAPASSPGIAPAPAPTR